MPRRSQRPSMRSPDDMPQAVGCWPIRSATSLACGISIRCASHFARSHIRRLTSRAISGADGSASGGRPIVILYLPSSNSQSEIIRPGIFVCVSICISPLSNLMTAPCAYSGAGRMPFRLDARLSRTESASRSDAYLGAESSTRPLRHLAVNRRAFRRGEIYTSASRGS